MIFTLFFSSIFNVNAQKDSEKEMVEAYEGEVRELVSFLEFSLNVIGNPAYSVKDKDEIINKSYLKVFRDDKVQIEDDLDEHRDVVTNKDVQAYLKDVDFFFKKVSFKFNIIDIANNVNQDGKMFFTIKLMRNLKGITIEDDSVDSDQERYIEVNVDEEDKDLKIASIYTTKLSRDEELAYWWNELNTAWKVQLGAGIEVKDGLLLYEIDEFSDSTYVMGGVQVKDTIRIIDFVKQAANKEEINLSGSTIIKDLKPLDQFKKLRKLNISSSVINDLFPIRNLTTIEVLDCSNTKVEDLNPLKYSKSLQELYIDNTPVSSIEVIESFNQLKILHLKQTVIDTIPSLDNLTHLQELDCSNTNLTTLDSIGQLKSLINLNFSNTSISDIDPLSNLKNLKKLTFDNTQVVDLEPLQHLGNLDTIICENTKVADLSALRGLEDLKIIYADNSDLDMDDYRVISAAIPNVEVIFITDELRTFWDNLDMDWKDLIEAKLGLSNLESKEQLHRILKIKALKIHENAKGLSPLKYTPLLEVLDFSDTQVSDIAHLVNTQNLSVIKGQNSMAIDLSPIKGLGKLKELNFDHTKISDISALAGMQHLDSLFFNNTDIKDISVLNSVSGFQAAYFEQTQVEDEDFLDLNFDEDSSVVVYKTERLRAWWGNMDDDWQSIFRKSNNLDTRPTPEHLHQLASKTELEIKSFSLTNLDPLPEFVRLKSLKFTDSQITSLYPLIKLTKLEKLECPRNPISDIEALSALENLQVLDLESTQISDLKPIRSLKVLRELKFSGSYVKDLSPVSGLKQLEVLEFSKTKVRNINALSGLENLKVLKCYNNRLSDKKVEEFKANNPDCDVVFY